MQIPPNTIIGLPTTVNIVALDANNHIVPNYTGTVSFSSSTDPTANFSATSYTFQPSDHGHTSFQVTFDTLGSQSVTVADVNTSATTGTASTNVVPAPVATQFLLILPPNVPANVPVQGFIVPLDASGHPVPNYAGTVSFASSDGQATLPPNITFQASASVFQPFTVTFATTGPQSLTATGTDDNGNTITGTVSTNVTAVQVPTSLQIDAPPNAPIGVPVLVRVDVLDANSNPIPDFAGQITLTSGDPNAKIVSLAAVTAGGAAFESVCRGLWYDRFSDADGHRNHRFVDNASVGQRGARHSRPAAAAADRAEPADQSTATRLEQLTPG